MCSGSERHVFLLLNCQKLLCVALRRFVCRGKAGAAELLLWRSLGSGEWGWNRQF
jgi:hypothetical protein